MCSTSTVRRAYVGGEGFENIQEEDVKELLESHQEELTKEDLEELIPSTEESDDEEEVMVLEPVTTKMLTEVLQMSKFLLTGFLRSIHSRREHKM